MQIVDLIIETDWALSLDDASPAPIARAATFVRHTKHANPVCVRDAPSCRASSMGMQNRVMQLVAHDRRRASQEASSRRWH
jgi:hypothetical protein